MKATARAPMYLRIKSYVVEHIDSGAWPVAHQIPPELELMKQFRVSRMTVNRALSELASEGRISRHPGRGSFVTDPRPKSELLIVRSIAEEIRERGNRHSARVYTLESEPASKDLAKIFELPLGTPLFHSVIAHKENAVPIQLEERYVNPRLMPHYLEADFSKLTPNEVLAAVAQVKEAEQIIDAVLPDARTCRMLKIERDQPCLRVYRVARIAGGVSSVSWQTYPSNRYRLSSSFHDGGGSTHSG